MRAPAGTCGFRVAVSHLEEWPRAKVVAAPLAFGVLLIKKGKSDENMYSY